jgi:F420H(2)-dependent quinone reductase
MLLCPVMNNEKEWALTVAALAWAAHGASRATAAGAQTGSGNKDTARRVLAGMPLTGEYEPSPAAWARDQVELYERSDGTEGTELRGRPVIILTSVGAKTGKIRKTPLMRVEHDGEYAVVASKGGAASHPVWYYNLVANPQVELQDGAVKKEYLAREVSGAEREAWWERAVAAWPDYANYQKKTDRTIPVFVLTPAGG